MMIDDNDAQMIFGDLGGRNLPNICLTGEKNLTKETCPDQGSNLGLLHATTWPTAVDINKQNF